METIRKRNRLNVLFYVTYPYYFPHFLPIGNIFSIEGHNVTYILSAKNNSDNMKLIAKKNMLKYTFDEKHLFDENNDIVFFANIFTRLDEISACTIFLEHGIGTKSKSFYPYVQYFDIYLVEGAQKYKTVTELYPKFKDRVEKVGFSKFDTIIHFNAKEKDKYLKKYYLDKSKKTILYAPTFFPSSIEKMSDDFPNNFKECNIVIKPHYLTYERSRYKNQIKKFDKWNRHTNCTVLPLSEYNLVPWLAIADVMISDESSAMFEFAALNKPVISNRYFKLRWTYYFMPWKLNKRIDASKAKFREILDNAYSYTETIKYVKEALRNPEKLASKRVEFSEALAGKIDGKVSERIYGVVMKKYKGSK